MSGKKKVTGLSRLIKGVQDAVIKAQHMMKQQHLAHMSEFVDAEGNLEVIKIKMPSSVSGGETREISVPTMALAQTSGLKIEKMKMSFDVRLDNIEEGDDGDDEHEIHVRVERGLFGRGCKAKCEIEFRGDDAPEGLMRINDEIIKIL